MTKQIEMNAAAPEFSMPDFSGSTISLSDYRHRKNVVLVMNRGFMWPFCRRHMAQLRNDYNGFIARTSEVIVIGPDSPEAFNAYWIKNHMPFIGLLDPTHATLKRYGQQVKLFKLGRMPAQIIINQKGRVRYVHYGRSMTDIPVNADIFNVLDNLNAETTAGPENA